MIRKKENRPEAADHVRSKTRNQRRIDFLRSTGKSNISGRAPLLPVHSSPCRLHRWDRSGFDPRKVGSPAPGPTPAVGTTKHSMASTNQRRLGYAPRSPTSPSYECCGNQLSEDGNPIRPACAPQRPNEQVFLEQNPCPARVKLAFQNHMVLATCQQPWQGKYLEPSPRVLSQAGRPHPLFQIEPNRSRSLGSTCIASRGHKTT